MMVEKEVRRGVEFLIAATRTSETCNSVEHRRAMAALARSEWHRWEEEHDLPHVDPEDHVSIQIVSQSVLDRGIDWAQWLVKVRTEIGHFTETFHELVTVKLDGADDAGRARVDDYLLVVRDGRMWSPWR